MDAYDRGVHRREGLIIQPHLCRQVTAKIVDQRISPADEADQCGFSFVAAEVEGHAFLVDIEGLKILAVVLTEHERTGLAGRVAADRRIFDLDDFGSKVSKEHGAVRGGSKLLHRDDAYAMKGHHATGFLLISCLAMMIRCISLVPSPIQVSGAS